MQVRTSVVDITPPIGVALSPSGKMAEGIDDKLEANILIFSEDYIPTILVTFDLIYVGDLITNHLRKRLSKYFSNDRIILAASHTHNGPATNSKLSNLGHASTEYLNFVGEAVAIKVEELLANTFETATIVMVKEGSTESSINRRRFRLAYLGKKGLRINKIALAPNHQGANDKTISVIYVYSQSGSLACIIWHYACHPVITPSRARISADFPGVVRRKFREMYGQEKLPVLFLQGACGDLRPNNVASYKDGILISLKLLARGPFFVPFTNESSTTWVDQLFADILKCEDYKQPSMDLALKKIRSKRQEFDSSFFTDKSPVSKMVISTVSLGGVVLIGVSAEPTVFFSHFAKKHIQNHKVLVYGCLEEVWGYLPSVSQILDKKSYESHYFTKYFSCGSLKQDGPLIVMEEIKNIY